MAYGTLNAGTITPGSGNTLTVSETVNVVSSLKLAGTAITSTAAELNLLDGSSVTNATVSKAVVLDSSGNIALPNTKGISFAATADGGVSTPSELLDDYEEGTWTPTWSTTVTGTVVAYRTQTGHYIKDGGLVTCWGLLITDATTWLGSIVQLGGLPFSADGDSRIRGYVTQAESFGGDYPLTMAFATTTKMYCWVRNASDGVTSVLLVADMDAGDFKNYIEFCVTYKAVS